MKKINRYFAAILLFVAIGPYVQGQQEADNLAIEVSRSNFKAKTIAPPSPEAAELGKYGNMPVSLFTGTPQISVPLYELAGSNISIPISLSYHASGYRPGTIAP